MQLYVIMLRWKLHILAQEHHTRKRDLISRRRFNQELGGVGARRSCTQMMCVRVTGSPGRILEAITPRCR